MSDNVVGFIEGHCEREVRAYKRSYIAEAPVNKRTVIRLAERRLRGCLDGE